MLGVFGDPAVTGKPAGDDLREGKRTYLIAASLAAVGPEGRRTIHDRLGDPALDSAGVAELRQIIADSGALARTELRIAELTETALAALETVDLDQQATDVLRELAAASTSRVD